MEVEDPYEIVEAAEELLVVSGLSTKPDPPAEPEIKRHVAEISQQMLTRVLRSLERDGMVRRTVHPSTPPQVEYALTELGSSLAETVRGLAVWATRNQTVIRANPALYDARRE